MRRDIIGQLRQVHQDRRWRDEHRRRDEGGRAFRARRQIVKRLVGALGLDAPRAAIGDPGENIIRGAAIVFQADHVGRVKCQTRGRQREGHILAADPFLIKRAAGSAVCQCRRIDDRELFRAHPGGVHCDPPRLDRQRAVILVGHQQAPFQRARQFGFLRPCETDVLGVAVGDHEGLGGDLGHGGASARHEAQLATGLDDIEAEELGQRRDRGAGAFNGSDGIAGDSGRQLADIDQVQWHTAGAADLADQFDQAATADPSGQPMTEAVVVNVRPDIGTDRECGIGAGVPCPDRDLGGVDHPAGIEPPMPGFSPDRSNKDRAPRCTGAAPDHLDSRVRNTARRIPTISDHGRRWAGWCRDRQQVPRPR